MRRDSLIKFITFIFLLSIGLSACTNLQATAGMIDVVVEIEGQIRNVQIPTGSTVQQAIESSGYEPGPLDRISPPSYTVLEQGSKIIIVPIEEVFEIEQIVIPFDRQTIRNEALTEGESRLLQPGKNGVQEITYRILIEAGIETSRAPVKNIILEQPVSEIVMIGTQTAHTPITIDGVFVYVSGGNAWLIEGNSANRQPVVLSGDLDGRILEISPDGDWLLYSRAIADEEEQINSLWVSSLDNPELDPVDLGVSNVIHFADWVPQSSTLTIAYSTVEPSPAAPGWQANNDLLTITFTPAGRPLRPREIIESNAGGQYGWWGTDFAWGSNNDSLAYMRADSIGLVNLDAERLEELTTVTPFQTLSDWAWVPGLAWGHDAQTLYYVNHGDPVGFESPQASPIFHLFAQSLRGGSGLALVERTGLFAYPSVSPIIDVDTIEISYKIAFLQAITPLESQESSYRLIVMDRDGSNQEALFPSLGEPGIAPIEPAWSPGGDRIAVMYRGDIWIVDVSSGQGQPLTSDGLAVSFDWSG